MQRNGGPTRPIGYGGCVGLGLPLALSLGGDGNLVATPDDPATPPDTVKSLVPSACEPGPLSPLQAGDLAAGAVKVWLCGGGNSDADGQASWLGDRFVGYPDPLTSNAAAAGEAFNALPRVTARPTAVRTSSTTPSSRLRWTSGACPWGCRSWWP